MYPDDDYVELGCDRVVAETKSAVLLEVGENKPVWFPRSVVKDHQQLGKDDAPGTVEIKTWFAHKQGLI